MSLVCGSRAEREKACPVLPLQRRREGEPGSGVTRRASEYRRAGTPADRLVVAVKLLLAGVGVERRGRLIGNVSSFNQGPQGAWEEAR